MIVALAVKMTVKEVVIQTQQKMILTIIPKQKKLMIIFKAACLNPKEQELLVFEAIQLATDYFTKTYTDVQSRMAFKQEPLNIIDPKRL